MLARGAGMVVRSIKPDYSHIEKRSFTYAPFSVENPNIHGVDVALEIEKVVYFPDAFNLVSSSNISINILSIIVWCCRRGRCPARIYAFWLM